VSTLLGWAALPELWTVIFRLMSPPWLAPPPAFWPSTRPESFRYPFCRLLELTVTVSVNLPVSSHVPEPPLLPVQLEDMWMAPVSTWT
jgi:hypothetical protein